MFSRLLTNFGPLRTALLLAGVVLLGFAPFADPTGGYRGYGLYTNVITPTLASLLVFVIALDMLMSRVFMSDSVAHERARLRRIISLEALLLVVLLIAWAPFILALTD